jgi:hypothetical protein
MTEIQAQIIEMLRQGNSYSTIQEELCVSSKTISATKKAFMGGENSSNDRLSSTFLQHDPDPPPRTGNWKTIDSSQQNLNNYQPKKTQKNMSNYNSVIDDDDYIDKEDEPVTKLSLEKLRLQLEHEREMQKLEAISDKEDREYRLREKEIQLNRDQFDAVQRQKSDEMRALLFRIKKLTEQCEDGEYSYEDVDSMHDDATELLSDCEKYCFINEIKFEESEYQTILSSIISTFEEFLDSTDEDDSNDLEFDEDLEESISKVNFRKF